MDYADPGARVCASQCADTLMLKRFNARKQSCFVDKNTPAKRGGYNLMNECDTGSVVWFLEHVKLQADHEAKDGPR